MTAVPFYDSAAQRHPMLEGVLELGRYRDLLWMLVALSLTVRYKRSLLGLGWTLVNPLLHMLVLTLAFATLFGDQLPRYPVYVLTGLLVFDFFSQTTTFAMNQLSWGTSLLGRVYVPAAVFPLSAVGTSLVNLVVTLVPLALIMAWVANPVGWALLFLPLPVLLLAMLSLGFGFVLATMALSFNDITNMWGVLLRAWYFLTPIMYPPGIIPQRLQWLLDLNPLHHLLVCIREPIYSGTLPPPHHLATSAVWAVFSLLLGWWYFSARRFEFALQA
ncbi:MAG: ABC transporter permease [Thermoanaerobaculum sp.]|nr:ABC transporter permease [Thermoanaerobaculum sp.]MDW7966766.1 ABC transporter permease [Thermoanaerobaculum sp.]